MNSSFSNWLLLAVGFGLVAADDVGIDDAAKEGGAGFVAPPTLTTLFSPVARRRLMLLVDVVVTMGRFVGGISLWFSARWYYLVLVLSLERG